MSIPHEPGLYWASTAIKGEYDAILRIYGKAPFLKTELMRLHVTQLGKDIDPNLLIHPIAGPRVDIPAMT